jgi:hypothetical protein
MIGLVYILRVEHTMPHHTALTVTHIPGTTAGRNSKVYAVMLGCSSEDIATVEDKFSSSRHSAASPFSIIKIFLELERQHRFWEVDSKITRFSNLIHNYGRFPLGTTNVSETSHVGYTNHAQDPENLIGLYIDVCHLKHNLEAWKVQITDFKQFVNDFPDKADIDPAEYLQRLATLYEHKINKCDLVLQGTSLTFQMETAHLSRIDARLARLDTEIALRDGKQMKAIALLTMFFLPATFVASLMAVPVFDWGSVTSIPQWSIYLVLFVPMTVIVLMAYTAWNRWFKPNVLHSLSQL